MLAGLFIAINLNYSVQQVMGILRSQDSKYAYNFSTMFRYHLGYNDLVLWDIGIAQPDAEKLRPVRELSCIKMIDSSYSKHIRPDSSGAEKI